MVLGEAFYTTLFTLHGNPAIDSLMIYFAEYLVLFVPLILVCLWFQSRTGEEDSLYTFYTVVTGLTVSYCMGLIYSHGNPSTVFDTLVAQKPENAFPSQHTTVVVASALAYFQRDRRNLGLLMAAAAVLTGVARIYIGVHWPIDILGSLVAASLGLGVAYISWDRLEPVWRPALDLYDRIFSQVIGRLKQLG